MVVAARQEVQSLIVEEMVNVSVAQMQEQTVEVVNRILHEWVSARVVEQMADVPVPLDVRMVTHKNVQKTVEVPKACSLTRW